MFMINGQHTPWIDARDRGLQFGDGCFTTARIVNGQVRYLDHHLARLRRDARRLGIGPLSWRTLRAEIKTLVQNEERGVLKVVITRGSGGRGYAPASGMTATRMLSLAPWPEHYDRLRQTGIRLATSPVPLGNNPWLAGIKHLNRLEQVLIRMHLEQTACDEALVLDSAGMLVECCAANLFWRKGQAVFTPDLQQCGVQGTMRRHIMRKLEESRFSLQVVRTGREALAKADEVVVCNALMPVLAVTAIDDNHYQQRALFEFLAPRCE